MINKISFFWDTQLIPTPGLMHPCPGFTLVMMTMERNNKRDQSPWCPCQTRHTLQSSHVGEQTKILPGQLNTIIAPSKIFLNEHHHSIEKPSTNSIASSCLYKHYLQLYSKLKIHKS